jgi:hypothetical protein
MTTSTSSEPIANLKPIRYSRAFGRTARLSAERSLPHASEDRAHARGAFGQARVGSGHWVDDRADYPCLSEAATVSTPMLPGS